MLSLTLLFRSHQTENDHKQLIRNSIHFILFNSIPNYINNLLIIAFSFLHRNLPYKSTVTSDFKRDGGSNCFIESAFNYGAKSKKSFEYRAGNISLVKLAYQIFALYLGDRLYSVHAAEEQYRIDKQTVF